MSRADEINVRSPIIAHETLGADCCGCLVVRLDGDQAQIVCNECRALIRTFPAAEVEAALWAMWSRLMLSVPSCLQ
jgi:hypothetical protein